MELKRSAQAGATRGALWAMTRGRGTYQPVMVGGKTVAVGDRPCEERARHMLDVLAEVHADSVVDYGCAEGYFVRRCAEAGYPAVGVESDPRRIAVAALSLATDKVADFGFIRTRIANDTIGRLPDSDATVTLSLWHHIMSAKGVDYALMLLRTLGTKTRKVLLFEMGQSNEQHLWSPGMPDMGADPHKWIAGFLEEAGFVDVRKLCEVPSAFSSVRRAMFVGFVQ